MKIYQIRTKLITAGIQVNDEGKITKEGVAPIFKWAIGKDFSWFIKYLEKENILLQYTDISTKEEVIVNQGIVDPPTINPIKDKKAAICPDCDGTGHGNTENAICSECTGKGFVTKIMTLTDIPDEAEPLEDEETHEDN